MFFIMDTCSVAVLTLWYEGNGTAVHDEVGELPSDSHRSFQHALLGGLEKQTAIINTATTTKPIQLIIQR